MYRTRSADIYTGGGGDPVRKTHVSIGDDDGFSAKLFIAWIFLPVFYVIWLWIDTYWLAYNVKSSADSCLSGISSACQNIVLYQAHYEATKKLLNDTSKDVPLMMFGMIILYGGVNRFVYISK